VPLDGGGGWVVKDGGQTVDAHALAAAFEHSADQMKVKIAAFMF
jgi:hypothetical protein